MGPDKSENLTSRIWAPALVVITVVIVTMPALKFEFVLHDDGPDILQNPDFFPFNGASLRRIWSSPGFSYFYTPLSQTALGALAMLSRWWHGLGALDTPTPDVFHAAGLVLHLVNTWLVFRLLQRVTADRERTNEPRWLVVLSALFFALHPAQVESYVRAGNVSITLGGCLSLLALGFFLRSLDGKERSRACLAFLFFVLAILTHPSAIALPLVAFALAWAAQQATPRTLILRLVPWLVACVAYLAWTFIVHPARPDLTALGGRPWGRLLIAADSLTWYVAQAVWPSSLTIDHGRTTQMVLASPTAWLSLVGVGTATVVLISCARNWRWMAAGAVIFLVLLLPVCGILAAAYHDGLSIVSDRHLYLPLFGVSIVVAGGLSRIRPDLRFVLGVPLVCLLGLLSRNYQRVWSDSISLFRHVLAVNPRSWYGANQLGTALLLVGKPAEAVPLLARSLDMKPGMIDTRITLSQALLDSGHNEEAERLLRETVKLAPGQGHVHSNLSVALLRRDGWKEAEREARIALELSPAHPMAMANLALSLAGQARREEALVEARYTVSTHPAFSLGWRVLSEILYEAGQKHESREAMMRACELDPRRQDWRELLTTRHYEGSEIRPPAPSPSNKEQ